MNFYTKLILLLILFTGNVGLLFGQTDTCISNLKKANTYYDDGNFDQAIHLLNGTIKGCPLSQKDLLQAEKLLILCYLGIDNLEEADKTAAAIMKIDPNFTPDKFKDDPKLSALFVKYKPEPTLVAGINGGINLPLVNVVNTYSVVHADETPGLASYKSIISYQFGASVEKRIFKKLWLDLEFQFRNSKYSHTLDSVENTTISYSEKMNYIDLPLSLKYFFLNKSLSPYIMVGADFSFLLQALSTTERDDQKDLVDRTALRNKFTIGYFGSAGLNYNFRQLNFFGEIRYTFFPDFINRDGTRYADDINLYKYYYIDDDFKMDNMQFNIGATYILTYKIKKVQ